MEPQAEKWQDLRGKFNSPESEDYKKAMDEGKFDPYLGDKAFMDSQNDGSFFEKPNEEPPNMDALQPQTSNLADEPKPEATPEPPSGEQDTSNEPLWKQKGFASEKEMVEKFDLYNTLLEKKQEQIDRFNRERGQEGLKTKKELFEVQKRANELQALLDAQKNATPDVDIELPSMPEFPIAEDGDYASADFGGKVKEYQQKMMDYNAKVRKFGDVSVRTARELAETRRLISEQGEKLNNLSTFTEVQKREHVQKQAINAWNETVSQINDLQKDFPELKTTKSFEDINSLINTYGAEAAYAQLPGKDVEVHKQIVDIVRSYRDFDDDGNIVAESKPKFSTLKSAHIDKLVATGKWDEYLKRHAEEAAVRGRKQVIDKMQEVDSGARTLPIGGEQQDIVRSSTQGEDLAMLEHYATPEGELDLRSNIGKRRQYVELLQRNGMATAIPDEYLKEYQKE